MRQNDLLKSDAGDHLRVLLLRRAAILCCQLSTLQNAVSNLNVEPFTDGKAAAGYVPSTRARRGYFPNANASSVTAAPN